MKTPALVLALFATASLVAAEPAPASAPAPETTAGQPALSPEQRQQITANLPKYTPAPKPADPFAPVTHIRQESVARAPENQKEAGASDPDVLELPKLTVKQQTPRPRPRLSESAILGPKAFNEELAKKNFSALDHSILNKWTLPSWLGGQSAADRAREDYNVSQKRQFLDDVLTISKAVEQTDPAAAKALKDAAAKP